MVIVILIVLGLCLGSFVNAFVWRHYQAWELKEKRDALQKANKKDSAKELEALGSKLKTLSITRGRSMCTHCRHELAAKDLIPVVSYLWLRGRCRYCGKRIEDSPLAELLTPLLFVVSYVWWPLDMSGGGLVLFICWLVFIVGFVALILYDLRWFLLPHAIVLPLIGLAVLEILVRAIFFGGGWQLVLGSAVGALIVGGLFYVLYAVSKGRWIGGGDITLGVLLGLLAGSVGGALLLIFLASLLGTIVAAPLLALGRANRGTHLPFGPFLIIAAVIVVLFGQGIIHWYTHQFLTF